MVEGQGPLGNGMPQVGVRRHVGAGVNLLKEHGRNRRIRQNFAHLLVAMKDGGLVTYVRKTQSIL